MPLRNGTHALTNLASRKEATIASRNEDSVTQEFDFGPALNCYTQGEEIELLNFNGNLDFYSHLEDFPDAFTLSVWFKRTEVSDESEQVLVERTNNRLQASFDPDSGFLDL